MTIFHWPEAPLAHLEYSCGAPQPLLPITAATRREQGKYQTVYQPLLPNTDATRMERGKYQPVYHPFLPITTATRMELEKYQTVYQPLLTIKAATRMEREKYRTVTSHYSCHPAGARKVPYIFFSHYFTLQLPPGWRKLRTRHFSSCYFPLQMQPGWSKESTRQFISHYFPLQLPQQIAASITIKYKETNHNKNHKLYVTCHLTTTLYSFSCYESTSRLSDAAARGLVIERRKRSKKTKKEALLWLEISIPLQ